MFDEINLNYTRVLRIFDDGSGEIWSCGTRLIQFTRNELETLRDIQLPVRKFIPGPENEKDVHTEHCCFYHGCKYYKEDCPVVTRQKQQSHACWDCQEG